MLYQGIIGGGSSPVEPVDLSPVLLWENSSVSTNFGEQTVNLDLTQYTGVIVEFYTSTATNSISSRIYIKKTDTYTNSMGAGYFLGSPYARNVEVTDTGVKFGNCYSSSAQNGNLIPSKIYGVKEYVVEPVVGDLLWTNPSPNEELALTQLTGDYSKYKSLVVEAKVNASANFTSKFNIAKSDGTYTAGILLTAISLDEDYYRRITLTNDKITLGSGIQVKSATTITPRNNVAIPIKIYGIE